jgi:hypothetical protein
MSVPGVNLESTSDDLRSGTDRCHDKPPATSDARRCANSGPCQSSAFAIGPEFYQKLAKLMGKRIAELRWIVSLRRLLRHLSVNWS